MSAPLRPGPIRVGMVGSGFMGREHSAAYRLLPLLLGDGVPPIELGRIAGGRRVHEVGPRYGWRESADDSRAVTEADDIDVVDVVTPNDSHAALTISAAEHGKHVVCEKPLVRDSAEAQTMRDAVAEAGVHAAVCFVYRSWPRSNSPANSSTRDGSGVCTATAGTSCTTTSPTAANRRRGASTRRRPAPG